MRTHNCTVDCFKFVFAWIVVFFHFYGATPRYFAGGYIAVEYFLLVASVFVYEKYEKKIGRGGYIISRFKRLFPWTFSAFLFSAIVVRGYLAHTVAVGKILDNFAYDFGEIILLKMNGIATTSAALLNGPSWTVSSMLLVEFLLWYCLSHHNRLFQELIAPLSIVLGLGIWAHVQDTQVKTWVGITTFGTLRTWIVYCEGYYCYRLMKRLKAICFNRLGMAVMTSAECMIYVFSVGVMMRRSSRYYQWMLTFLFMLAIAISLSGHSILNRLLSNSLILKKFSSFLGQLSLSVFLMHGSILSLLNHFFQDPLIRYRHSLHMIGIVTCCAVMQWYCVPKCIRFGQKVKVITKKYLIEG